MNKFSIAYFGSSDFSADFLEKLITDPTSPDSVGIREASQLVEVKFVVTQPDRPVGRKQILTPTPVKIIAQKYGIAIKSQILNHKSQINPKSKIQNSKRLEFGNLDLFGTWNLEFGALKDIDLALVYAYGQIIPQEFLNWPKHGFWCLHPSLLPKYRGTSPMATVLINGDRETGMTIIKMDEEIDHGPIIAQEKYRILPEDKRPDLEKKLTELGFKMFRSVILSDPATAGESKDLSKIKPIPQNHKQATYTKKLSKQDGFIEFEKLKELLLTTNYQPPTTIYNLFRGLTPWPGIWTLLRPDGGASEGQALPKRLKITDLSLVNGKLIIKKVQLEGKKETDFGTFNKVYNVL